MIRVPVLPPVPLLSRVTPVEVAAMLPHVVTGADGVEHLIVPAHGGYVGRWTTPLDVDTK